MRIYVPSRGRYRSAFLHGATSPLNWAPRHRLSYVVRDDEYDRYRKVLPENVECIPCGAPPNLSQKRVWIAQYAQGRGERTHAQCDDDVKLFIRKDDDNVSLRDPSPAEVQMMLDYMERLLAGEYPMVGVSAREGNNHGGAGPAPLLVECTRSMRFYAFRTDDLLSIDSGRMPEMADFDTTLQFLRSGRKNCVLFYWAQNQPRTQHPGGCAVYRTNETHDAAARRLAELHPNFVSVYTKVTKSKRKKRVAFDERTEVRVQWQKAYESSQRREAASERHAAADNQVARGSSPAKEPGDHGAQEHRQRAPGDSGPAVR